MKKILKNESIFESLSLLRQELLTLKENENCKEIDEAVYIVDEIITSFRGIRRIILILFVALIISIGVAILFYQYNTKVEDFNKEIKDHRNDSIVREILDIKEVTFGDSVNTSYDYVTRGKKIITYKQFNLENDSLKKVILFLNQKMLKSEISINKLEHEVALVQDKLNLVYENYDIKFVEHDKYIQIEGKKVDSALVLLQVFRNRLQYDEKTKSWTIKK